MTDRKPPKPVRAWAVVDKHGQVIVPRLWSVHSLSVAFTTQRLAKSWCRPNQRPIRVTITPEPSDG